MPAQCVQKLIDDGCKVGVRMHNALSCDYHWHLENELIVCRSGSVTVMLDGRSYTLGGGMCFFCRSEGVHCVESTPDSEVECVLYDSSICSGTANLLPTEPLFYDKYNAYARIEEMFREQESKERFYADRMNASMALLLVDIFRGEKFRGGAKPESRAMNRYKDLLTTIDNKYNEMSFTNAAAFMNMSEAYFSRFFKKTSGMTFSRYLNAVRVSKAIDIMKERPDITMAALMSECGFNTLRNFNRVFKEVTGYPPSHLPKDYVFNIRNISDSEKADGSDEE